MKNNIKSYDLYEKLIESFSKDGLKAFSADNPLLLELEKMTEKYDQFFFLVDLININILFTSKRSLQMVGVNPADLNLYHFYDITHPDDIQKLSLGRAKLLKLAHNIFVAEKGIALLSTNHWLRNPSGNYSNILLQLYLFYSTIPHKSAYLLKIHTNIDWVKKIKHGFHYYLGNNLSNFRFPDEELLGINKPFSDREFEIIKLIASSMSSEEIAEKIFLSVHTINTHRRNILKKSVKSTLSELIYDLIDQGII